MSTVHRKRWICYRNVNFRFSRPLAIYWYVFCLNWFRGGYKLPVGFWLRFLIGVVCFQRYHKFTVLQPTNGDFRLTLVGQGRKNWKHIYRLPIDLYGLGRNSFSGFVALAPVSTRVPQPRTVDPFVTSDHYHQVGKRPWAMGSYQSPWFFFPFILPAFSPERSSPQLFISFFSP